MHAATQKLLPSSRRVDGHRLDPLSQPGVQQSHSIDSAPIFAMDRLKQELAKKSHTHTEKCLLISGASGGCHDGMCTATINAFVPRILSKGA